MTMYRVVIQADDGRGIEIVGEDLLAIVELATQSVLTNDTGVKTPTVGTEDWWDFLHSLPDSLKNSEHIGAVMAMWEGQNLTQHSADAFVAELQRRIRAQNGPTP